MEKQLENKDIKPFIYAGNATFTLLNSKTGNRFTYKVRKSKGNDIFFVSVLTGSNNDVDYTYLGFIKMGDFILSKKSKITDNAISYKAFKWFFINMGNLPEFIQVFHKNKCGRCGRTLTTPDSIKRGIGPECSRLI